MAEGHDDTYIAQQLKRPVRSVFDVRMHLNILRNGGWQPLEGAPVVMIEDVATTGASLLRAIRVVQQAGAQVPLAISLVDRGAGAGDLLAEAGVQYLTLVGHDDLGIAPIRVA